MFMIRSATPDRNLGRTHLHHLLASQAARARNRVGASGAPAGVGPPGTALRSSPATAAAILAAAHPAEIDLEALRTSEAEGLLASLLQQRVSLMQQAELAMELGSLHVAVSAEGKITESLRLTAQLTNSLVQHHSVSHSHVLVSEDYFPHAAHYLATLPWRPCAVTGPVDLLHRLL
jgi:hypothetical protein